MKTIIAILLTALMLHSCQSEDSNEDTFIEVALDCFVIDQNGNDLLNTDNEESFSHNDIKVYYLKDGQKLKEFDKEDLEYQPNDFMLIEPSGSETRYKIRLFLNHSKDDEFPVTIVKWDDNSEDVFKAEYYRVGYSVTLIKAWLNDELFYSTEEKYHKEEIVKQL